MSRGIVVELHIGGGRSEHHRFSAVSGSLGRGSMTATDQSEENPEMPAVHGSYRSNALAKKVAVWPRVTGKVGR